MCGITGVYLKNPAIVDTENDRIQFDRFIDELLLGIEERGRDATGFVAVRDTHVQLDKKAIPADSFIKTRKRSWLDGGTRMVLGHTRFATQGHQSHFENNHPVMYGSTFVTHNGHIHNDDAVYEQLELDRYAEVDSSAIAASLHWHGFAKAKDALEMLGGGFAIAAIDPVNQPGTLLLAKGGTYPLAYLETKHIFVWASTSHAILDAWKKVLGTPPALPKVKYLSAGDMLWIKDGQVERKFSAFTPKPKYTSYTSSYSGSSGGSRVGFAWDGWPSDEPRGTSCVTRPRGVVTLMDNANYMAAKRQTGGGRAITWDRKDQMSQEQVKLHNGKWSTCMHCKMMVAEMCIITHSEWGEVCWDCLTYGMEQKSKESTNRVSAAEFADMSEDDLDTLDEYAALELDMANDIMERIANDTGLTLTLVNWLICHSQFITLGYNTDKLREKLLFLYSDLEAKILDGDFDEDAEEAEAIEVDEKDIPIPPARQLEPPKSSDMGKCDHCKKKAILLTYENARQYRWCSKHIGKCFKRGCNADPVAWGTDGRRWCHPHARHVKGLTYIAKAKVAA